MSAALAGGMIIGYSLGNSGINPYYLHAFLLLCLVTVSVTWIICKLLNYRDASRGK